MLTLQNFSSLIMVPSWLPLLLAPDDFLYLFVVTLPVNVWGARRVLQWLQDPCNKELVFCTKSVFLNGFLHMAIARNLCRQLPSSPSSPSYMPHIHILNHIRRTSSFSLTVRSCMLMGVHPNSPQFKLPLSLRFLSFSFSLPRGSHVCVLGIAVQLTQEFMRHEATSL